MALPFDYIQSLRDEISKKQQHEIYMLYKSAYRTLLRYKEGSLNNTRLTQTQIDLLLDQTRAAMQNVAKGEYNVAYSGIEAIASAAGRLLRPTDISFTARVVRSLVTGSVYGPSRTWSLSSAIWGDSNRKLRDIYSIVARGMILGESTEQIADKLLKYVNPDKAFYWTGPGSLHIYSHQVDYNAQRLVRTLTTHAYQKAVVDATYNDPALIGYRWHANGSRACPICQDRNGTIYSKDDVPWDHPNGMCYIEPVYGAARVGYDDIIGWALSEDGEYPSLDEFMKPYLDRVTSNKR